MTYEELREESQSLKDHLKTLSPGMPGYVETLQAIEDNAFHMVNQLKHELAAEFKLKPVDPVCNKTLLLL